MELGATLRALSDRNVNRSYAAAGLPATPSSASSAAAARLRLELRRHALYRRVAAVLRGAEDHTAAWREMVADATF